MVRKNKKGFTLIEVLVVLAIIGVLSTLTMVALNYAREQSKITKARHDIDRIVIAIKFLENDTKQWPGHQAVDEVTTKGTNEIWDLSVGRAGLAQTDGYFPGWNGPYMKNIPTDPWGNNYFWDSDYEVNGEKRVVVGSFGPNGEGQNLYDSDDIYKLLH